MTTPLLGRTSTVADPVNVRRLEQVIATSRAILASASLLAYQLDPSKPTAYVQQTYGLLIGYVVFSLAMLLLLRFQRQVARTYLWVAIAVDVLWPVAISLLTLGFNSPFFLFFIFALLAAAYRGGMRTALVTAVVLVFLLLCDGLLLTRGLVASVGPPVDTNALITRSAYLLIIGFLIGYLAENERQMRAELSTIARLIGLAKVDSGLTGTLKSVVQELLEIFESPRVFVAFRENCSGRVVLWDFVPVDEEVVLQTSEVEFAQRKNYFFDMPDGILRAVRKSARGNPELLFFDSEGDRIQDVTCPIPANLADVHPYKTLVVAAIPTGPEWSARLFLLNPAARNTVPPRLLSLQLLLRHVSPSVHNVFLIRRLKSRAAAQERARMARELHDGVVQALAAIEMRLYLLRKQATKDPDEVAADAKYIQQLVHEQVASLRQLIHQIKPLDFHPRQLLDFLATMVEKFRETGIAARFVSDLNEVLVSPEVGREVARIVQEALVNVHKHSGAHNVLVRFAAENGNWKLIIEDDGRGFTFSGRLSNAELDESRQGPLVIKERVRSIGGELTIESYAGRGARLEITFPQKAQVAHA